MYWQESKDDERRAIPDDIVDVAFAIRCRTLPVDHAWALAEAVKAVLPWVAEEPGVGIHSLHVADSGNGWMRPEGPDELLYPSRRTKLVVRVPKHRIEDAKRLSGATLDIAGHSVAVEQGAARSLSDHATVFSRYVVTDSAPDEETFLAEAHAALATIGVRPKKMLCGIERLIATPQERLRTRSLMLADLPVEESIKLQQQGLGPERLLGCGLFIPHKSIREVGAAQG